MYIYIYIYTHVYRERERYPNNRGVRPEMDPGVSANKEKKSHAHE